jgi:hypothetical protein
MQHRLGLLLLNTPVNANMPHAAGIMKRSLSESILCFSQRKDGNRRPTEPAICRTK